MHLQIFQVTFLHIFIQTDVINYFLIFSWNGIFLTTKGDKSVFTKMKVMFKKVSVEENLSQCAKNIVGVIIFE
jgi:hypothetical protein